MKARRRRLPVVFVTVVMLTACAQVLGADFDVHPRAKPAEGANTSGGSASGHAAGANATVTGGDSSGAGEAGHGGGNTSVTHDLSGAAGVHAGDAEAVAGAGGVRSDSNAGAGHGEEPGSAGGANAGPACGVARAWTPVDATTTGPRAIPTSTLARAVGVIRDHDGTPRCNGVLIASGLVLLPRCDVVAGDVFAMNVRLPTPDSIEPVSEFPIDGWEVRGSRFTLAWLARVAPWDAFPPAPWRARRIRAGEMLRLVTHHADGFARARAEPVPDDAPAATSTRGDTAQSRAAPAFADDGKLVGFCVADECGIEHCDQVADLVAVSPTLRVLEAMGGLFWGDTTGDARADAIVINTNAVAVRSAADPPEAAAAYWLREPFYGDRQNLLTDVTGDGLADLLALGDRIIIAPSTGSEFGLPLELPLESSATGPFVAADVDGDGASDLVEMRAGKLRVRRFIQGDLGLEEAWGDVSCELPCELRLADVNGDRRSDAVLVRPNTLEVALSTGVAFDEPATWSSDAATGLPGWHFADITGDGAADAIAIDLSRSAVFPSDGTRFQPRPRPWQPELPLGERGNYFADVTGDGIADAIVHEHNSLELFVSDGAGNFTRKTLMNSAYFGGL